MLQLSNLSVIGPLGAAVLSGVNYNLTHCIHRKKVSRPPILLTCACVRTGTDDILCHFCYLNVL